MNRREFIRGEAAVAAASAVPEALAAPAFEDIRDGEVYRFEGGTLGSLIPSGFHINGFVLRQFICNRARAARKHPEYPGIYRELLRDGGRILEVELGEGLKPENDTVVREIEVTAGWVEEFWRRHKDDPDLFRGCKLDLTCR